MKSQRRHAPVERVRREFLWLKAIHQDDAQATFGQRDCQRHSGHAAPGNGHIGSQIHQIIVH